MTPNLFEAYQAEIRGVEAQIESERKALSTEEDRSQAEFLRFRAKNLGKVLETLKSNLTSIVVAERNAEDLQVRFIRWRELCAVARDAQDTMEALAKKIGPAVTACVPVANAVARAEAALEQHRSRPLPDYPTQPEIARKEAEEGKLKLALDELRANLRELQTAAGHARSAWTTAAQKFDEACFKERMARLPSEEPAVSKFSRVA
jgi:chromosome segregation ATPase